MISSFPSTSLAPSPLRVDPSFLSPPFPPSCELTLPSPLSSPFSSLPLHAVLWSGEKQLQNQIDYLEEQLKQKSKSLQSSTASHQNLESQLHELQLKYRNLDSKFHETQSQLEDSEYRIRHYEQSSEVDKISLTRIEYLEKELKSNEMNLKNLLKDFHEKEFLLQSYEAKIGNLESGMSEKNLLIQELENKSRGMERMRNNEKQSEMRIQLIEQELNEKNQQIGLSIPPPLSSSSLP